MAVTYFVDINASYTMVANPTSGMDTNPFDYSAFIEYLDNGTYEHVGTNERIFHIRGHREITSDIYISDTLANFNDANTVHLLPWDDGEFWSIHNPSTSGAGYVSAILNGKTGKRGVQTLDIVNGIFDGCQVYFDIIEHYLVNTTEFTLYISNSWIRATSQSAGYIGKISINDYENVWLVNSNIIVNNAYGYNRRLELGNQSNVSMHVYNTIIAVNILGSNFASPSYTASIFFTQTSFEYSGWTTETGISYTLNDSLGYIESPVSIFSAASLSAFIPDDINYMNPAFSGLTTYGTTENYPPLSYQYELSGGLRDGVGSLYFEQPTTTIAGYPTAMSGNIPVSFILSAYNSGYINPNSKRDFYFDNGSSLLDQSSTVTCASTSYTYPDIFHPYIRFYSPHEWNTIDTTPLNFSAYETSLGAQFVVTNESSASIISAYMNENIVLSAFNISGHPYRITFNYGDGAATILTYTPDNTTIPLTTYQYPIQGSYLPSILIENAIGQTFSADNPNYLDIYNRPLSANYSVPEPIIDTGSYVNYYVNIDSMYTGSGSNTGLSANPFTYDEFIERISLSGSGETNDKYNLTGYRKIVMPYSGSENWAIKSNPSKKFVIDAWDSSATGPWMLILYCNSINPEFNPKISFANSILKNGIIYNVPIFNIGSQFEVSVLYDMFINSVGLSSSIKFVPTTGIYENYFSAIPYTNDCFLIGSTVYTEGGITDNFESDYRINNIDSVFRNFVIFNDENYSHFSGCTLNSYNCSYDLPLPTTAIREYDSFDGGIIDSYWNSAFQTYYTSAVYPTSGTEYAVSAVPPFGGYFITPNLIGGDFSLEFGIIMSNQDYTVSGYPMGIHVIFEDSTHDMYDPLSNKYLGMNNDYDTTVYHKLVYKDFDDVITITRDFTYSAYSEIKFKMVRKNTTIYAYTNTGSGWELLYTDETPIIEGKQFEIYAVSYLNYGFTYLDFRSTAFSISADVNNQYDWEHTEPYPFTQWHNNYQQDINYILAHKSDLAPFIHISTPPQPGYNYPDYPGYEVGLFGYSRSNYVRQ